MQEIEYDKKSLGNGPWQQEPDRLEFEAHGLPCLAVRNAMGSWCGYVAVSEGHPFYEYEYNQCTKGNCLENSCEHSPEAKIDVHGGLTYSQKCEGPICHVPKPGEPDNVWWFGFDCSHAYDLTPRLHKFQSKNFPASPFLKLTEIYRDMNYIRKETTRLAKQLADLK